MRIKHKVRLKIGDDTSMKDLLYSDDEDLSEVILDAFEKQASGKIDIPAGESLTLSFGDVTLVKGLRLRVDGDVKLKLNGSATDLQLRRGTTTTGTLAQFFMEGDISSAVLTAPLDTDITGRYCVWGDPAT